MAYALIKNDRVVQLSQNPAAEFHPDVAAEFTEVPDTVSPGQVLVDGVFEDEPQPEIPVIKTPVVWTETGFANNLTSAERIAYKESTDAVIVDMREVLTSTGLSLTNPDFEGYVDKLVELSIISAEKGATFKAAPKYIGE